MCIRDRDWDATAVQRLKKAGAIPFATTNVPELGFWFETENKIYGRTNNPYDFSRTPGGSSGGEGAILGAGGSPMGLGSDIGGSIRMPAFFCGIAGHKPTNRLVPLTGQFPYSREEIRELAGDRYPYTTIGPMAKYVRDLWPMLQIISGADGIDPETRKDISLGGENLELTRLKVLVLEDPIIHMTTRASQELREEVRKCARLLEQFGAQVEELDRKIFLRSLECWTVALKQTKESHERFSDHLSPHEPLDYLRELKNLVLGNSHYTWPAFITAVFDEFALENVRNGDEVLTEMEKIKKQLKFLLKGDTVVLMPPHPSIAPQHGAPLFRPFDFQYTGCWNWLGLPATAVPTGLNARGLPLGVQIAADHFRDALCLRVAELIEQSFGGWTPPAHL
ncbi:MAG: amidase, partial [Bdellovibrionaceae bacterium]|nr:amidase [Pseudobdellovibrionaceae bacterium]